MPIRRWYDSYTCATFQNFGGLGAGGRSAVRTLMGHWTHGGKTMKLSPASDVAKLAVRRRSQTRSTVSIKFWLAIAPNTL